MSYSDLITKVTDLIADPSVTEANVRGFIADAELDMERQMLAASNVPRQMLARKDDQKSDSNGRYTIPDDMLKQRTVTVNQTPLLYVSPGKVLNGEGYGDADVILDYYQRIPKLSDTVTTNWLLDIGEDVYTYAACSEYEPWAQDGTAPFTQRYLSALANLLKAYSPQQRGGRVTVRKRPWGGIYTIIGSQIYLGRSGTI